MNTSNLTRWLVTCVLLSLIAFWGGYQLSPTYAPPATTPELPPLSDLARVYMQAHYPSNQHSQVTYFRRSQFMNVEIETWGVMPYPNSLELFIRCYPDSRICIDTNEE